MDDVVQDVFLRMQRCLAGLRDEERFGAWVYQVARTAVVDHQRRAAKHRVAEPGVLGEEAPEIEQDDRASKIRRDATSPRHSSSGWKTFIPAVQQREHFGCRRITFPDWQFRECRSERFHRPRREVNAPPELGTELGTEHADVVETADLKSEGHEIAH